MMRSSDPSFNFVKTCVLCFFVSLQLAPNKSPSVINAMKFVKNPYKMCEKLHNLVANLTGQLKELISQKSYDPRGENSYIRVKSY